MPLSRRELAKAMVLTTIPRAVVGRPYAVVGAGVFGAWTAYQLQGAGHSVTLVDAYGPASSRASSGGETRIIRASYGKDEVYTRMAVRSLALWSAFFAGTGHELLHRTGVLWMAKPENAYAKDSRETLRRVGVEFEDLGPADLRRRYPQIRTDAGVGAILEVDSGALMARQAVQAVVAEFIKIGGTYRHAFVQTPRGNGRVEELTVSDGVKIEADGFVFACGPWLGKVFPDILGERIFTSRQEVMFFGVPQEIGDSSRRRCRFGSILATSTSAGCTASRASKSAASRSRLICMGRHSIPIRATDW